MNAIDKPRAMQTPEAPKPPINLEAEQALLGALLLNNAVLDRLDFLEADDFAHPLNAEIFQACRATIEAGSVADPKTLKGLAGGDYLTELYASACSVANARDYALVVKDTANRRRLMAIADDAANWAATAPPDARATEYITGLQAELDEMVIGAQVGGPRSLAQVFQGTAAKVHAMHAKGGGLLGLSTGLYDLDQVLGGLAAGSLLILGGSTSMGKTALALAIADAAAQPLAEHGIAPGPVLYVSLEMPADDLALRLLAARSGGAYARMRRGLVTEEELARVMAASTENAPPLYIEDSPKITPRGLRARARALQRRDGLGMVVVDYLQLMRPDALRRDGNRNLEITDISQALKALSTELGVPVLALSQLSRAHQNRTDKRPILSDLRESGSIEQDADVVMFVYREHHANPDGNKTKDAEERERWLSAKGIVECIVAKNRQGPTETVRLGIKVETNRVWSLGSADSRQGGFQV